MSHAILASWEKSFRGRIFPSYLRLVFRYQSLPRSSPGSKLFSRSAANSAIHSYIVTFVSTRQNEGMMGLNPGGVRPEERWIWRVGMERHSASIEFQRGMCFIHLTVYLDLLQDSLRHPRKMQPAKYLCCEFYLFPHRFSTNYSMTPARLAYPKYAAGLDVVRRRQIFKLSRNGTTITALSLLQISLQIVWANNC